MDLVLPPPPPRRSPGCPSSPEFEFWVTRNPSLPATHLLSADELFSDGVLLPLHLLHHSDPTPATTGAPPPVEVEACGADSDPSPAITSSAPISGSKRWMDIFRGISGEKKSSAAGAAVEEKTAPVAPVEKSKRRERKLSAGGAAELNINIWPFSRSRSAGNSAGGGSRQKFSSSAAAAAAGRKVSSAPCSRSNSRGESSRPPAAAGRRCPSSPGRLRLENGGGIHVGRSSPVWQVRKGTKKVAEGADGLAGGGTGGSAGHSGKRGGLNGRGGRGPNLKVDPCTGYPQQGSCRGENKEGAAGGDRTVGGGNGSHSHHHYFNLRALFSKKVY